MVSVAMLEALLDDLFSSIAVIRSPFTAQVRECGSQCQRSVTDFDDVNAIEYVLSVAHVVTALYFLSWTFQTSTSYFNTIFGK